LAGCASTGGTEGPTAEERAAQLAADINAIKADSATVSGDTVTLTGGIRLGNTVLTVPSGVTLDLTKETLQLGDNATFTVNGTVNARAEGVNIDSAAANPATINGSGTISLRSKGRMLGIWEGKKLTLDGVTLVGLKDNDTSLISIENGGEFVMKSGVIMGNAHIEDESSNGGGVSASDGGGVSVKGGIFTMNGGEIYGNTAKSDKGGYGGGVYVGRSGSFVLKSGTIAGNSANSGGGVFVGGTSNFTMEGGTISGNTVRGGGSNGGGVSIWGSTFIMLDGAISGNSADESVGIGGGVFMASADNNCTMEGGVISGNSANEGGGVRVNNNFTLKGGRIQGDTDSDGFTKNTANDGGSAALQVKNNGAAKWGEGGAYTKGGLSQTSGTDIVSLDDSGVGGTNDTLIAMPAK
jgi:hypothetical protein